MTRFRWWLALPALLIATSGPSEAAEVRDKAGMFSPEAVRKAQAEVDRIESEYSVPVTIEAIPSLNGEPIKDVTTRHAMSVGAHGIYVLIAKSESKIYAEASRGFLKYLPRTRLQAIDDAFVAEFKKHDFDAGLIRGVAKVDSTLAEARTEAGGTLKPDPTPGARRAAPAAAPINRPRVAGNNSWGVGSLLTIVIVILGVFLVLRIIGALFSGARGGYGGPARMGGPGGYGPGGPGYGAPGYGGGGGGGFMSSMFGGIGGALAGNWLYDQFSGGRHHGSVDQTSYDPAAGAAPEAAPEWGEGGAGGDWGGGGADAGGGGGGDWGGGGGGDWGGGGGGGDDNGGGW